MDLFNPQVSLYIEAAPTDQKALLQALRELIHEALPGIAEDYKWSRPIFSLAKPVAYLACHKNHVTLGFYSGAMEFEDLDGLLEGDGKTMRHVKFREGILHHRETLLSWLCQYAPY